MNTPTRKTVALLFSDVAGYSRMSEPQLRDFLKTVVPGVAALIHPHRTEFIELNTWGDALLIASEDPYTLSRIALNLRDYYRNRNWAEDHLPNDLSVRIALHAAVVFQGTDSIRETNGIIGTQVNLAARIEPVTAPGEVWVTEQFMKLIDAQSDQTIAFDDLGERLLAKKFGSTRLWRLRRHHDHSVSPRDVQVETLATDTSSELDLALHMARHGSEGQQIIALDVLDKYPVPDSIAILIECAKDKNASDAVRGMALGSLQVLKSKTAVPDLITVLQDTTEQPHIKDFVVKVLGAVRDPRALPVLEDAIFSSNDLGVDTIESAIVAVGTIGDPRGIPILKQAYEHIEHFRPMLSSLIWASSVLNDSLFVPYLQQILRDRSLPSEVRSSAIESLMMNSPNLSDDVFIEVVLDATELDEVRRKAVQALTSIPTAKTRRVLVDIASDLSSPLASQALVVLTKGPALLEEQAKRHREMAKGKFRDG